MSEEEKIRGKKIKIETKNIIYKKMSLLNEIQILLRSHSCLCTSITSEDKV